MNRHWASPLAAIGLIASTSIGAAAGVVVTRTETVVSGQIAPQLRHPRQSTLMIEGNREKISLGGGREIIIDLDRSTMEIVDPERKNYLEMPFPPTGTMVEVVGGPSLHVAKVSKTGKSQTIAGYRCDDYDVAGKLPVGSFTMRDCISTEAPGASDFSGFENRLMAKLKESRPEIRTSLPEGLPLIEETTIQMNAHDPANFTQMPREMAERLKAQLANRPPLVTRTEVTKVEARKVEVAEFEIPRGYARSEQPTDRPTSNADAQSKSFSPANFPEVLKGDIALGMDVRPGGQVHIDRTIQFDGHRYEILLADNAIAPEGWGHGKEYSAQSCSVRGKIEPKADDGVSQFTIIATAINCKNVPSSSGKTSSQSAE